MRLKRPEGLNIIPFIDIMLVLLAIVLTVATFVSQENIKVAVPKATQGVTTTDKKSYEIIIKENDEIFYENTKVSFEELNEAISKLLDEDSITLKADQKSKFGSFISVIDLLKLHQKEHINIVVRKD
jgi:biopolymer transport protein ExbD